MTAGRVLRISEPLAGSSRVSQTSNLFIGDEFRNPRLSSWGSPGVLTQGGFPGTIFEMSAWTVDLLNNLCKEARQAAASRDFSMHTLLNRNRP